MTAGASIGQSRAESHQQTGGDEQRYRGCHRDFRSSNKIRNDPCANGQADLAIATTEPGSISQRTFERFGFQVLYTRAILLRN